MGLNIKKSGKSNFVIDYHVILKMVVTFNIHGKDNSNFDLQNSETKTARKCTNSRKFNLLYR